MQVLSAPNMIDHQQRTLMNLFQRFIEIHSDDYDNLQGASLAKQQVNQNIKREWNYFKEQINTNPINTDKITTYFHLLEKNQIENNADSSPVHSPLLRPSQNQQQMSASSKSPNTRFMTISPNDVPKDAFKKIGFKRSTNALQNKTNTSTNPLDNAGSSNTLQPEGYFSPQVQPNSNKVFSQALNQFEKNNVRNSRSPISGQNANQSNFNSFTVSASTFSNQMQQQTQIQALSSPEIPQKQQQLQLQYSNQTYNASQPTISNNPTGDSNTQPQQRGLIKVDETTFSPPSFPTEPINKQPQQQNISKFNNSNNNNNENSSSHSESSSTRNSQDIVNNISNFQQNNNASMNQVTVGNLTTAPSLNTTTITQNNTSIQIENLKNQAQQFYKDYKNQQQDSQRSNQSQQDSTRNIYQPTSNTSIQPTIGLLSANQIGQQQMQQQQQYQIPPLPLNQFQGEGQRGLPHNPQVQMIIQSHNQSGQAHSLDHNQGNRTQTMQNINQYRALSPTPQSTSYNTFSENRVQSPNGRLGNNPQLLQQLQQQSQLPPTNPTKNALNYKNKLLQATNQAVPLNQLQVVSSPTPIQPKSESFSGAFSNPQNIPLSTFNQGQNYHQTGQRYPSPSPLINGISPRHQFPQQQAPTTNFSEQQAVIDEMLRYQFKTKSVLEKTQLLETFMKNNTSAINSIFNE